MNDSRMKNKRAARTIVLLSKEDKVIKLSYIIPPSDELDRFERSRRGKRADDNNRRRCDGRNSLNNSIESGSNHDDTLQKA